MPVLLFREEKSTSEKIVSRFIKMVFLVIIMGYLLVITKLYEVLSILVFLLLVYVTRKWIYRKKELDPRSFTRVTLRAWDTLDGLRNIKKYYIGKWSRARLEKVKDRISLLPFAPLIAGVILLVLIGISAYIRFYDVFVHAAPPLSDSYVTLAWMKYIDGRKLFEDGIYPQGFHIYLATLLKFSAIDGLYVLRYTGPLNILLLIIGLYYFIRKLTDSFVGGVVGATIFGLLSGYIPNLPIDRQAATNSQEFAFIFLLPSLYFLVMYLINGRKDYLCTGMIGTTIIGLVHMLVFGHIGISIGLLVLAYFIVNKFKHWQRGIRMWGMAVLTVVASLLPLGVGRVLGRTVHSASSEFLVSTAKEKVGSQELYAIDYIALASIAIIAVVTSLFYKHLSHQLRLVCSFTVLIGISTFILYYFVGKWTNSTLIASRAIDLWAIILCLCIGIGVASLLAFWSFSAKRDWVEIGIAGIALVVLVGTYPPTIINPYKMQHDAVIEQYLNISEQFPVQTWQLISFNEGYSLVLGKGFHMHLDEFVERYDPKKKELTKFLEEESDKEIPPNNFVVFEKNMFQVSKTNSIYSIMKGKYEKRQEHYANLQKWLDTYKKNHKKVTVYYEDENIVIYHFHREKTKKERSGFLNL